MPDDKFDDVLSSIFGNDKKPEEQGAPEKAPQGTPEAAPEAAPAPAKPVGGKPLGGARPLMGGMGGKGAPVRPGASKGPGATKARPPVSRTGVRPNAAYSGHSPSQTGSYAAPSSVPMSSHAQKAAVQRGSSTLLLLVVLLLNVILLVIGIVAIVRVTSLNAEVKGMQTTIEVLKQRSKVYAGVTYMGPDKRPQLYLMQMDYDSDPGSVKFGKTIYKPVE